MTVKMVAVDPSNIAAIGHGEGGLHVQFKNGGTYRYPTVTAAEHQALMNSPSKGRHLSANIVGKHKHEKVADAH